MALQRAIGRIEGQLTFYTSRLANLESTLQRQIEVVAKEVINVRDNLISKPQIEGMIVEIESLKTDVETFKTDRSLIRGGWRTAVWVAASFGGVIVFVIEVTRFVVEFTVPGK